MSNDFSNVEFAAGSLIGRRAFNLTSSGMLLGPVFPEEFGPGINEARCNAGLSRLWYRPVANEHVVGEKRCGCGYYAYYDNGFNPHERTATVVGIIEGWGRCTVGDRGFRCSKAKLVAVVKPPEIVAQESWRRVKKNLRIKHRSSWLLPAVLAFNLLVAINYFRAGLWPLASLHGACAGLVMASWRGFRQRERTVAIAKAQKKYAEYSLSHRHWMPMVWERFTQNYPDVKQYDTVDQMLAAHPLSTPPEESKIPPGPTEEELFRQMLQAGALNIGSFTWTQPPKDDEEVTDGESDTDPTGSEGGGQGS